MAVRGGVESPTFPFSGAYATSLHVAGQGPMGHLAAKPWHVVGRYGLASASVGSPSRCRVGLAPAASPVGARRWVLGGAQCRARSSASGDCGIPSLAAGDDGMQVAEQGGGEHGVGLAGG
jgi:hypothetical protein